MEGGGSEPRCPGNAARPPPLPSRPELPAAVRARGRAVQADGRLLPPIASRSGGGGFRPSNLARPIGEALGGRRGRDFRRRGGGFVCEERSGRRARGPGSPAGSAAVAAFSGPGPARLRPPPSRGAAERPPAGC